jgi:predicted ATPase with chaperone activity
MKKEGSGFDLPMALGILGAYGALNKRELNEFVMVGELSLDGSLRGVRVAWRGRAPGRRLQRRTRAAHR